jgi:hypothetical protein
LELADARIDGLLVVVNSEPGSSPVSRLQNAVDSIVIPAVVHGWKK